jgi:hypothetical protein
MSQSTILLATVLGAFVLYLAANDRLKTYLGIMGL